MVVTAAPLTTSPLLCPGDAQLLFATRAGRRSDQITPVAQGRRDGRPPGVEHDPGQREAAERAVILGHVGSGGGGGRLRGRHDQDAQHLAAKVSLVEDLWRHALPPHVRR